MAVINVYLLLWTLGAATISSRGDYPNYSDDQDDGDDEDYNYVIADQDDGDDEDYNYVIADQDDGDDEDYNYDVAEGYSGSGEGDVRVLDDKNTKRLPISSAEARISLRGAASGGTYFCLLCAILSSFVLS